MSVTHKEGETDSPLMMRSCNLLWREGSQSRKGSHIYWFYSCVECAGESCLPYLHSLQTPHHWITSLPSENEVSKMEICHTESYHKEHSWSRSKVKQTRIDRNPLDLFDLWEIVRVPVCQNLGGHFKSWCCRQFHWDLPFFKKTLATDFFCFLQRSRQKPFPVVRESRVRSLNRNREGEMWG